MGSGFKARAACKRPAEDSSWGTSAAGMTNQLPFTGESFNDAPTHDVREDLVGSPASKEPEIIAVDDTGGMTFEPNFEGLEYLFHAAMGFMCPTVYAGVYGTGSGGSPAPTGDGAFYHLFQLDEDLHRQPWAAGERAVSSGISTDPTYWLPTDQKVRCVDLAVDKELPAGMAHLHLNSMVNKWTWKVTPQKAAFECDFIAWKNYTGGSANKASWVMPANTDRALFTGSNLYASGLGSALTTKWGIQEIELSGENNLSQDRQSIAAGHADALYIIEPNRTNVRKITGRVKLARFSTDQWDTWMDGNTDVQMMIEHIGDTIAGSTHPFSLRWLMARAKITKAHFPVAGPGIITGDVEFEAILPTTTLFGWMTDLLGGITDVKASELMLLLCNTQDACIARDRQAGGVSLP